MHRVRTRVTIANVVYDGNLGDGWSDWGWGPHDLKQGAPARVSFDGFGGIILHHDELPSQFGGLSFRFRAPPGYGDFLQVSLQYKQVDEEKLPLVPIEPRHIALLDGGWSEVLVPWAALDPDGSPFDRIQISARLSTPPGMVELDHIVLTKADATSSVPTTSLSPATPVHLYVDCGKPVTRISPLVYGVAGGSWALGSPARRLGGNPMTRLNWDIGNAWNTGSDWFFENVQGSTTTLSQWIDDDVAHGVKTALVVPMIGWVAKDTTSVGFPVSELPPQQKHDQYRPEAGDGIRADGSPMSPLPPTQTSVAVPPEVVRRWIETVRDHDRARGKRGVDEYILDNEPNLWSTTHRDVHPSPLTYDELLDRTIQYGSAIRKADPDAVIAGPAAWGWSAYFYSAKDLVDHHSDQRAHDGVPLLSWYLKKLSDHERRTGTRILDVLDVHFYPQAPHVYGGDAATDPATAALRIRSTRSLWDPTYHDESWIDDSVNLIPRLKALIAENYPGRGISIGEWSFGADDHISGALAIAEALGRFGQEGITSAYYWTGPAAGTPGFFAFRAFRNYDGNGGQFLDWSIPARGTDGVSVFASRDDSRTHVVAILLNEDPTRAVQADVDVTSCGPVASKRVFSYDGDGPGFRTKTNSATNVSERLAPYSINVVELTLAKKP